MKKKNITQQCLLFRVSIILVLRPSQSKIFRSNSIDWIVLRRIGNISAIYRRAQNRNLLNLFQPDGVVLGGCEVDVDGAKSNRTMHSNYMRERGRGQKIWKERGRITRAWRYGAFIHLIRQPHRIHVNCFTKCYLLSIRIVLKYYLICLLVGWFGFFCPIREFFTHMKMSPLPVKGCRFCLCSALTAIEQWRLFYVLHLLWHGASVYNGHLRGPVTHIFCRAFGSGAVSTCFTTLVCRGLLRAFAWHAEGKVFESQPRQSCVVKTGNDSSIAKRSTTGMSVTGPQRLPLRMKIPCHSRCGTLKNPHCSVGQV